MASTIVSEVISAWLPTLPDGWKVERLDRHAWVRARLGWKGLTAAEYVDEGIPMLATPNIKGRHLDFAGVNRITQERYDESPEIKLSVGDVLLTKDGSTIGIVNRVAELPEPATVNGSIAVITPEDSVCSRFLTWTLASGYAQQLMSLLQGGMGVPHLFQSDIKRIPLPVPPLDEQRRIADFLDGETAQTDALIAKQRELVDLLCERRSALVRTSIPIPRQCEWPADKLGRWARVGNGSTPRRDEKRYWSGGTIPWLTSTVVNLNQVENASEFVTPVAVRECHLPIAEPGSLLIGLIGQGPTRGMATISRVRATLSQNLAYITPDPTRWVPEYLLWSLRASYKDIRQLGAESGAAQAMLNTDDIKRHLLVMPPLEEQSRIVAYLDEQTAKIDALIAKVEEFIALARERRTAQVTEAVMGRIDVTTGKWREGAGV